MKQESNVKILILYKFRRTTQVAAALHDTVEDTNTTFEEIEQHFGQEISMIVKDLTDDKSLPKPERKQQQLMNLKNISNEAKLVRLADKISNVCDIIDSPPVGWSDKTKKQYVDWCKNVVDELNFVHQGLVDTFYHHYDLFNKTN